MLLTNAVDLPADGIQKNQSAPLLLSTSHKGKGVKGPTQQKVSTLAEVGGGQLRRRS